MNGLYPASPQFPMGGLSENLSETRQPSSTSRRLVNVMPRDPVTRRLQGATRPGLRRFSKNSLGGPISNLTSVAVDVPGDEWIDRMGNLTEEWCSSLRGSTVHGHALGLRGDLFVLTFDGRVIRYNSEGTVAGQIELSLLPNEVVGRDLYVDFLGRVYVPIDGGVSGFNSRIVAYEPQEDNRPYKKVWTLTLEDRPMIRAMHGVTGSLYVAEASLDGGSGTLSRIDNIISAVPIRTTLAVLPSKVNALTTGEDGAIWVTAGSDPDRQSANVAGFVAPIFGVTVQDFNQSETRYWTSLRATNPLNGENLVDGARIDRWDDFRTFEAGGALSLPPMRNMQSQEPTDNSDFRPRFSSSAFGGRSGLQFEALDPITGGAITINNAGSILSTPLREGETIDDIYRSKVDATDVLSDQRSLFPRYSEPNFVSCWLVRFTPEDIARMLAYEGNLGPAYRIYLNADPAHNRATPILQDTTPGAVSFRFDDGAGGVGSFDGVVSNTLNVGLLTIIREGTTIQARLNGAPLGPPLPITSELGDFHPVWRGTKIGNPLQTPLQDSSLFNTGYSAFNGVLHRVETLLGPTIADPHDTPVTVPEMELLEGIICANAGVSAVLDPAHPYFDPINLPNAGTTLGTGQNSQALIQSNDPLLLKVGQNGEYIDTVTGPGYGYDVVSDGMGGMVTIGERTSENALDDTGYGATVMRRVLDLGTHIGLNQPAVGSLAILDVLAATDTVTFGTETYEFTFGAPVQPGNIEVAIPFAGNNTASAAFALQIAVLNNSALVQLDYQGDGENGIQPFVVTSLDPSEDGNLAVSTNTASISVEDLMGGDDQAGSWEVKADEESAPSENCARIDVARNGDIYAGWVPLTGDSTVRRYNNGGELQWAYPIPGFSACEIALEPFDVPEYVVDGPESLYVLGADTGDPSKAVRKLSLLERRRVLEPSRRMTYLAVSGQTLSSLEPGGGASEIGDLEASESRLVQSAVQGFQVFYTTGSGYFVYDAREQRFSKWVPTGGGEFPEGCELITAWRNRVVIARSRSNPSLWFMTREGDPFDADTLPVIFDSGAPVVATDSRAHDYPDIINALFTYDDDLLVIGGDRTINVVAGNPAAGGVYDNITDEVGVAFGSPIARDSRGAAYFIGSRGGVWRMSGRRVTELSQFTVGERFRNVNLAEYRYRLVWDEERKGLWVWQIRLTAAKPEIVEHWFWSSETEGWFPVEIGTEMMQPSAAEIFDGDDPDDRVIVLGCEDGVVRFICDDEATDDGVPICWEVQIGPLVGEEAFRRAMLVSVYAELALRDEEAILDILAGEVASEAELFGSVKLQDGVNGPLYDMRASGAYLYMAMRGRTERQPIAFENFRAELATAGPKRNLEWLR